MKKSITFLFSANVIMVSAIAQNTFPASGNVGIGTPAPAEKLSVVTATGVPGITHSDGTIKVGTFVGSGAGYYGTLSNHPLYFRTNNGAAQVALLQNGRLGIGTITPAGRLDVTGGDAFIQSVRVGIGNGNITTNTCVGRLTFSANTTGANNTGIGYGTLSTNTTGSFNTATGVSAIRWNTTGAQNTAYGYSALTRNSTGNFNVAIGSNSLRANTGGYSNVAIGVAALNNNILHSNLVAIGDSALYNTGANGITSQHDADFNTAIGSKALLNTATGRSNTAVGHQSMYFNWVGSFNTALGTGTLNSNSDGNYNTALGYGADVGEPTKDGPISFNNSTALGAHAFCGTDNEVSLGDYNIIRIDGAVDFTNISDGRVKKNISQNVPGLTFINKLTPITYNLDLDAIDKIRQVDVAKRRNEKLEKFRAQKQAVVYTGFIAQDVEKAAKESDYNFSGVDAAKNERDLYGLRYSEFVVPLVKSVQELSKQNEELLKRIDLLETIVARITKKFTESETTSIQNVNVSSASMQQNLPNPFNKSTAINYTLPLKKVDAKIMITDKGGKTVKELNVSGSGKGTVNINAAALSTGTYQYSLYVNGQLVDTKQMILSW